MNRKGKLTTKGKHAVILTLTIVACVAAMLFSLLLSVLCDGKHVSSAAHTQSDITPGIMAGSQEAGDRPADTAMAVLSEQWKCD